MKSVIKTPHSRTGYVCISTMLNPKADYYATSVADCDARGNVDINQRAWIRNWPSMRSAFDGHKEFVEEFSRPKRHSVAHHSR